MSLDALRNALPEYAKDTKLNLGSVLANSTLPNRLVWGAALGCAISSRCASVIRALHDEARQHLTEQEMTAAKAAASIMAMNNIYYRARHMITDEGYQNMRTGLRMQVIGSHGVDKVDFELWCLAVSAVTGCGACVESHERTVVQAGTPRETVNEMLKIAAVVHAAAVTLEAEEALLSSLDSDAS